MSIGGQEVCLLINNCRIIIILNAASADQELDLSLFSLLSDSSRKTETMFSSVCEMTWSLCFREGLYEQPVF